MNNPASWWSNRACAAILMIAAALPLIWPAIPPLTDLPGHLGSYKIEIDGGASPWLRHYFAFRWAPVGNLGVDLPMLALGPLLGVELAAKLIVMTIPPLTVAGMLLVAREIHGRVPPTALFALPLAYAFPFQFGFVNFSLAAALMFVGIGLWLRIARPRLRAAIFVPFGFLLFFAHSIGWGMFGLAIFAIEIVAARKSGSTWPVSLWHALIACLPLAPPLLAMVDWWLHRSEDVPIDFSGWRAKFYYLSAVLRSDHEAFDLLGGRLLILLVVLAALGRGMRIDARLGAAALALSAAFLLMPNTLLGASYADMRIAPYALALAVLAIAPRIERRAWLNLAAAAGLVFFGARLASDGWTYVRLDRAYRDQLAALDHVPVGARIFAMANVPCPDTWSQPRIDHLGSLAIVRRDAFVNGQWAMPGGRLLSVLYAPANGFALDPTQFLEPEACRKMGSYSLEQVVARLPRAAFDYLWLIDLPPDRWPRDPGLLPVWHGRRGILYRIGTPPG